MTRQERYGIYAALVGVYIFSLYFGVLVTTETKDRHLHRAQQYHQEHQEARQMNRSRACTRHVAAIAHTVDFWSASTADRAFKACMEEW